MTTAVIDAKASRFPWWGVLLQGIFSLVVGILLLTDPLATTLVIVQFLGLYWLVAGIFALVGLFVDRRLWGWKLFSGLLGIFAGIAVLQHPLWSSVLVPTTVVIFLGVDGLIIGIVGIIAAFQGGGLGSAVFGAFSIILGGLLLGSPYLTGLALPWVYGAFAVVGGIISVFAAIRQRSAEAA